MLLDKPLVLTTMVNILRISPVLRDQFHGTSREVHIVICKFLIEQEYRQDSSHHSSRRIIVHIGHPMGLSPAATTQTLSRIFTGECRLVIVPVCDGLRVSAPHIWCLRLSMPKGQVRHLYDEPIFQRVTM